MNNNEYEVCLLDEEEQIINEIIKADNKKINDWFNLEEPISTLNLATVIEVDRNISLKKAIEELNAKDVGALVVDDDSHDAVGIFTEDDVLKRVILKNLDLENEKLENYMTKNLVTLDENDPMSYALNKFIGNSIRYIPIRRNGEIKFMLSANDLIYWIASNSIESVINLPPDLHQATLADIGG